MLLFKHRFSVVALYRESNEETLGGFLGRRWSFWIALFSCFAFLVGNMVGQHGWHTFWKSVWGREGEIGFTGTMTPVEFIPNLSTWKGDRTVQTFHEVPKGDLIKLPEYVSDERCTPHAEGRYLYSVQYLGDYSFGGEGCGSHPGVDIVVPRGTPVRSIANGIVDRVERRDWGFGNTVVIRHPDMPLLDNAQERTTLYSVYAHLGDISVEQGQTVSKGDPLAVSGDSGLATTPHLHFQIDKETADFHPYWPFTTDEAREAGYSFSDAVDGGVGIAHARLYTVNPLLYVQKYAAENGAIVVERGEDAIIATEVGESASAMQNARRQDAIAKRRDRIEKRRSRVVAAARPVPSPIATTVRVVLADTTVDVPQPSPDLEAGKEYGPVAEIALVHDDTFMREKKQIVLYARDSAGNFLPRVQFTGKLYLTTIFGEAEFDPPELTAQNFDERGRALVTMIPRGRRTVIPAVRGAFSADGRPMVWKSTR